MSHSSVLWDTVSSKPIMSHAQQLEHRHNQRHRRFNTLSAIVLSSSSPSRILLNAFIWWIASNQRYPYATSSLAFVPTKTSTTAPSYSSSPPRSNRHNNFGDIHHHNLYWKVSTAVGVAMNPPSPTDADASSGANMHNTINNNSNGSVLLQQIQSTLQRTTAATAAGAARRKTKKKFERTAIPDSEQELRRLLLQRQKEYERILAKAKGGNPPSIWSFESLFPDPIWDEEVVQRDLYGVKKRDDGVALLSKTRRVQQEQKQQPQPQSQAESLSIQQRDKQQTPLFPLQPSALQPSQSRSPPPLPSGNFLLRALREPSTLVVPFLPFTNRTVASTSFVIQPNIATAVEPLPLNMALVREAQTIPVPAVNLSATQRVNVGMTRLVEEKVYGYRRGERGEISYVTSLIGDGAVQFRDGVRLGNPLAINADRLNYLAKKEMQKGRVEEAKELYQKALDIDPRDGRAYLGLSRCAERRRDFKLARECLKAGIARSKAEPGDRGANPFLLQALGCLEEKMGNLARAEEMYTGAARSRPSHAAAWVALAQLRTRKLGQSVAQGRACFRAAEREMKKAGVKIPAHVYTAWADLEFKKGGDTKKARELFQAALEIDPRCSVAWLQLGVLECGRGNHVEAEKCFETVLKFDNRNSRVLQAYALMESKRPDGNSRKALGLFEKALLANPRDAGVYQAYGLYVAKLGDIDSARDLFRRGAEVDKRHAALWQAWGVLETRHGKSEDARGIFQQGIWACAQPSGGQSGGRRCARLWQAWGVLEAKEGDHAAARRCFSRALDADGRNLPTITAWAMMEEKIGAVDNARQIYENALRKFAPGCDMKASLWRNYELMEQRLGDTAAAQQVYQRAMRETLLQRDETSTDGNISTLASKSETAASVDMPVKKSSEVELVRWNGGGEVWLNDNAIEGKVPLSLISRKS